MNITKKLLTTNFDVGRNGKKPEFIMIHTNGGPAPSGLFGYFNNPASKVSAHYQVNFAGNIEQYVEEGNTAWHGGGVDINNRSIGIEHEDKGNSKDSVRSNELYEVSSQLCADIYRRYGWDIENQAFMKPHHEFVPSRPCPDGLSISRIRQRTYDILHPKPAPVPVPTVDPRDAQIKDLKKQLQDSSISLQNALEEFRDDEMALITLTAEKEALNEDLSTEKTANLILTDNNQRLTEEFTALVGYKNSIWFKLSQIDFKAIILRLFKKQQ